MRRVAVAVVLVAVGVSVVWAQNAPRRWRIRQSQIRALISLNESMRENEARHTEILREMQAVAAEIRSDCAIPAALPLKPDLAAGEVVEVVSGS